MDNKDKEKAAPQNRSRSIDNHPVLWPIEKVADYFGVSTRTIHNGTKRNAAKKFTVPPIRIGRALRWDPEAIMEFVKGGGHE